MARDAVDTTMPPREREGIVVKVGRLPGHHGVTGRAVLREPGVGVIRIGRSIVVILMAEEAVGGCSFISVGVAGQAVEVAVPPGELEEVVVAVGRRPGDQGGSCSAAVR